MARIRCGKLFPKMTATLPILPAFCNDSCCFFHQLEPVSFLLDLGWPHDFLWPVECSCSDAVWLQSLGFQRSCSFHFHPLAMLLLLVSWDTSERPRALQSTAPAEPSPLQVCQLSVATPIIPGKKSCDRPDRQARQATDLWETVHCFNH